MAGRTPPEFSQLRAFLPKLVIEDGDDNPDGVDQKTVDHAQQILTMLEYAGARCTLVFWHGGDAIVFEWDQKMYLTITDDAGMVLDRTAPKPAALRSHEEGQ